MRQKFKPLITVAGLAVAGLIIYSYWFAPRPASVKLNFPREIKANQEIEVPLKISVSRNANAAEFYFDFSADLLQVKTFKQEDSVFTLWVTDPPRFDNEKGVLEIAGGAPTPGFKGQDLLIGKIVFTTRGAGEAIINLDEKISRILANDGLGTAIQYRWQPIKVGIKN